MSDRPHPDPGRVVADADVLAADLLVGGPSRRALDVVRSHSWIDLVASDALLADARAVIAAVASDELAGQWRDRIEAERVRVDHPDGDHPALASAKEGNAAHVLALDERLAGASANLSLQAHLRVSVRSPAAFVSVFDAAGLYDAVVGGAYPGPDRDPRA